MGAATYTQDTNPTDAVKRFWDRYIQYLLDKDINPTVARVIAFLQEQGRNMKIKDWQYRQIVDAIRKLFV